MKIPSPDFLRSRWFLLVGILLVGYAFFVLGKMVWMNYQRDQEIKNLAKDIQAIEQENQKLSDFIAFFQTDTFKEKEAREKLGVVKPGEKVLVFPDNKEGESNILEEKTSKDETQEIEKMPNYKKWWNFFFSGD